ncbi:hypothetical protein Ctob_014982, partial [Chrysochromulina tobinii]
MGLRSACFATLVAAASGAFEGLYCGEPTATNYVANPQPGFVNAPWTCSVVYKGCTNPLADNYESYATEPSLCMFLGTGCNDTFAMNFDPRATFNAGTCRYAKIGCTDPTAANYHSAFSISCAWATPPPDM